jgi:hypothetical protein
MPVGEEDERPIALPVPADLAGGFEHLLNLRRRQIFARSLGSVRGSARGDGRVEGAARDLGSEGFLLRRREPTFPFWSVGAARAPAAFLEAFAMGADYTFPLRAIYGKDLKLIIGFTGRIERTR